MSDNRIKDLRRFYSILDQLEMNVGGARKLADCHGRMEWPQRGVYFFRELGETRMETGEGLRIVRVGTHALKAGSGTKLWNRLSQHKGLAKTGGGNHRGSIFRLIVGTALIEKNSYKFPSWGQGNSTKSDTRKIEHPLEIEVSGVIRNMPFLWLMIEDDAGPDSLRGHIERNSIALLSNQNKLPIDPPSLNWLGNKCDRERVRSSGVWNQNHVDKDYDLAFLDRLEFLVSETEKNS